MESLLPSTTLDETLAFLYGRFDHERSTVPPDRSPSLQLERMRALLDRLGNPHHRLRIVHIAGTKGKGSTAALIRGVLAAAGLRVGLYTSPHLERLEERLEIDGRPCRPEELIALVDRVRPAVREMDAESQGERGPTFFEVTTALAMLHFCQQSVDVSVLEVGMGGRLDSTNVCQPVVSVITSISYDHTRQLGATLTRIANEKAGIIKPGVPVVSGVLAPEPRRVIRQTAAARGCPLVELGTDLHVDYAPPVDFAAARPRGRLDYRDDDMGVRFTDIPLRMLGRHQAVNAALAIAAALRVERRPDKRWEPAVRDGLGGTCVPARIEILERNPWVILDVAHNVASIEALLDTLAALPRGKRRVLVFAATREKDAAGMLRRLLPAFDDVVLTRYVNNPRAVPPRELELLVRRLLESVDFRPPPEIRTVPAPSDAWSYCRRVACADDLICISGSFFLAAEMRGLALPR